MSARDELCTCGCGKTRDVVVSEIMDSQSLNFEQASDLFNTSQMVRVEVQS